MDVGLFILLLGLALYALIIKLFWGAENGEDFLDIIMKMDFRQISNLPLIFNSSLGFMILALLIWSLPDGN